MTTLTLIPSIAHQLVNTPKAKKADLSSLMWVSSGAAYLPDHLATKLKALGPQNLNMTEGKRIGFCSFMLNNVGTVYARIWDVRIHALCLPKAVPRHP